MISRSRFLSLTGAALALARCSAKTIGAVRIGSKISTENTAIAEIYAVALERAKISVERHMNLGDAQSVMSALLRGDIDLYPEYIQTGTRDGVAWLMPSPVNDSPCLATSEYVAEEYWMLTLTACARIAGKLRFAAPAEFLAPGGALERLQRLYGGFDFKKVLPLDRGEQYDALGRGDADVASAFITDAEIAEKRLIVLADDKRFWPPYNVAPAMRASVLHAHPRIRPVLDRISNAVTNYTVQQMNMRMKLLYMDPHDVAVDFVDAHGLRG